MQSLKKFVIIGPESTGKSTLCQELSLHYRANWVPEFAREYLLTNGKEYTYDDLLTIARGQIAGEDRITGVPVQIQLPRSRKSPIFFIDTDMYVMKVWCEYVFGKCHQWIIDRIVERSYDLYLLCNTDLPWTKDELREYPDLKTRDILFHLYKDIMVNQNTPWIEIKGVQERRTALAIDSIDSFLLQ